MNETRTTRIVALMAGNGYFLSQAGDYWLKDKNPLLMSVFPVVLITLLGLSSAYISLFGRSERYWPLILEIVSALCFATVIAAWVIQAFRF
jgi:hypothetical protein